MHTNKENEIMVTRSLLQSSVEFYMDKLSTKESSRIFVTSDDEIKVEVAILSIDDYEYLKTREKEYEVYKSLQNASTKEIRDDNSSF